MVEQVRIRLHGYCGSILVRLIGTLSCSTRTPHVETGSVGFDNRYRLLLKLHGVETFLRS
jgi:hypothetical protein